MGHLVSLVSKIHSMKVSYITWNFSRLTVSDTSQYAVTGTSSSNGQTYYTLNVTNSITYALNNTNSMASETLSVLANLSAQGSLSSVQYFIYANGYAYNQTSTGSQAENLFLSSMAYFIMMQYTLNTSLNQIEQNQLHVNYTQNVMLGNLSFAETFYTLHETNFPPNVCSSNITMKSLSENIGIGKTQGYNGPVLLYASLEDYYTTPNSQEDIKVVFTLTYMSLG